MKINGNLSHKEIVYLVLNHGLNESKIRRAYESIARERVKADNKRMDEHMRKCGIGKYKKENKGRNPRLNYRDKGFESYTVGDREICRIGKKYYSSHFSESDYQISDRKSVIKISKEEFYRLTKK
jgi:hypothetical protein